MENYWIFSSSREADEVYNLQLWYFNSVDTLLISQDLKNITFLKQFLLAKIKFLVFVKHFLDRPT